MGLDPGNAEKGLSDIEKDLSGFGAGAQKAGDETDKALLSNRESVRLLSEEFGVHLPRAVSSAVAEMIPAISAVGPVLLGAFAVKEIPALVNGIQEAASAWEGFGKAEQEAMRKAIQDTAKLHGEVLNVEEELELFGKTEAAQAAKRAQWAGEDADRALKSLLDAENKERAIREKIAGVKEDLNAFTAGLGRIYESQLEQQEAQTAKLREAWKLAEQQALLAQKRATQAAADQTTATEKQGKALKDVQYTIAVINPQLLSMSKMIDGVTDAIDVDVESINLWENSLDGIRQVAPTVLQEINRQLVTIPQATMAFRLYAEAMHLSALATSETGQAAVGLAQQIAGMIGGRRAEAGVECVFEVAKGVQQVAMALDPYDPAHAQHALSAAQHFLSAAEFGKIAGTGSHRSSSAGGSSYGGGGGGGGVWAPPQTAAPGTAGGISGTLHVHIMGETQAGEWLANTLNNAVNRGVTLTATSSQRGAPVGH